MFPARPKCGWPPHILTSTQICHAYQDHEQWVSERLKTRIPSKPTGNVQAIYIQTTTRWNIIQTEF